MGHKIVVGLFDLCLSHYNQSEIIGDHPDHRCAEKCDEINHIEKFYGAI